MKNLHPPPLPSSRYLISDRTLLKIQNWNLFKANVKVRLLRIQIWHMQAFLRQSKYCVLIFTLTEIGVAFLYSIYNIINCRSRISTSIKHKHKLLCCCYREKKIVRMRMNWMKRIMFMWDDDYNVHDRIESKWKLCKRWTDLESSL